MHLMETTPPLLEIHAIDVNFHKRGQVIHAVRGVSFDVKRGTTVGIVGESGSGKSTLARSIMQLVPLASGQICFEGIDLAQVSKKQMTCNLCDKYQNRTTEHDWQLV